jgi:choline monooxygenase
MPYDEFQVHPDIRQAWTLPSRVYTDHTLYEAARETVFVPSWQFVGDLDRVKVPGQVAPFTLLEGFLDEPLVLTRDLDDRLHCLSNVCTHRGNIIVEQGGHERYLRCRYHGRRFALNGRFQQMPEFDGVEGFPCPADDLPNVSFGTWGKFAFASVAPSVPLDDVIGPMRERMAWLPLEEFTFDAGRSKDYLVHTNWALYVENYLDALHIPFVHAELSDALEYESYLTENYPCSNLQIGVTDGADLAFDLPPSSPDYGKRVTAYYFWLFPNTMFNFYPWGLSINVVRPLAVDRTRVSFLRYVWDAARSGSSVSSDAAVDRVEREDEVIVESVMRGVRSRFYDRGRYSPTREQGTHHFHRLLAEALNSGRVTP